jgi:hypothetical protein
VNERTEREELVELLGDAYEAWAHDHRNEGSSIAWQADAVLAWLNARQPVGSEAQRLAREQIEKRRDALSATASGAGPYSGRTEAAFAATELTWVLDLLASPVEPEQDATTRREPDRLYGEPGAEYLYDDPATVWESEIDPHREYAADLVDEWIIEEWTVKPVDVCVPSAVSIVEYVAEMTADDLEATEDPLPNITRNQAALAAAEALRAVFVGQVTWFSADKRVGERVVTIVDDEPHLDGEPMYRPVVSPLPPRAEPT